VDQLTGLVELLDESGLFDMFLDAMVSSLQDKQRTNNPYEKGSALYDEYRYNWYAGYTIAFVTKAVAGAQATKVVKSSKYAKKVTEFAKSTRAGKTAMRIKAPYDRGKARVATGLAKGGKKAAGPLVRRAKSAGATYRLWKLQQKAEVDTADLSEVEQKRVTRFLAQHGEEGAETLRRMDDDDIEALFRKMCGGASTFQRVGGGNGDGCDALPPDKQRAYEDAVIKSEIDESQLGEYLSEFDSDEYKTLKRLIAESGPSNTHLVWKLDQKATKQLIELVNDDNGVSYSDGADLLSTYRVYDEHDETDLRDIEDIQSDLIQLSNNNVKGLDDAIRAGTGDSVNNFKGLDGVADAATAVLRSDKSIKRLEVNYLKDGKIITDIDIELETCDAIEVKNYELSNIRDWTLEEAIERGGKAFDQRKKYINIKDKIKAYSKAKDENGGTFDGNQIIIAGRSGPSDDLKTLAEEMEDKLMEKYGWDVDVRYMEISQLDTV